MTSSLKVIEAVVAHRRRADSDNRAIHTTTLQQPRGFVGGFAASHRAALDRKSRSLPLRDAVLQAPCSNATLAKRRDRLQCKNAVRTTTVRDDRTTLGHG